MSQPSSDRPATLSLIDLVVIAAGSWPLLVAGPLLAGAIVFAAAQFQQVTFESSMRVEMTTSERRTFFDTLEDDASQQTVEISDRITLNDDVLTVTGRSREAVQTDLDRVIAGLSAIEDERLTRVENLEERTAFFRTRLNAIASDINDSVAQLAENSDESTPSVSLAIAVAAYAEQLRHEREYFQSQLENAREALAVFDEPAILTPPSSPRQRSGANPIVLAFLAAIAVEAFLLVLIFIRHGVLSASDPSRVRQRGQNPT